MALNNFIKLFCCDIFVCVDAALLNCSDQGPHSAFLPFDVRVEPEGWGTGGRGLGQRDRWIVGSGSVAHGGLSRVKLGQSALRNPLEHLFGENTQQLPTDVQSLEDRPVVVRTLSDEVLLKLLQELQVQQVV